MSGGSWPAISIVIPVYNGEERLPPLLESIRMQDYPQQRLEVIIVDDKSTDRTVEVAHHYGARVVTNGSHNYDIGKSIGIQHASHEFVMFIDDDNRLTQRDWLSRCMGALLENPDCVAAEPIWFRYDKGASIADRYTSLFGMNDPVVFYLNRRDRLMQIEKEWVLPGRVVQEKEDYFLVEFTKETLPTVGAQGFLTRQALLKKTHYQPFFFHMDSNLELAEMGFNRYAMMKLDIVHLHSKSLAKFIRKLKRNISLFHRYSRFRRYKYDITLPRLLWVGFLMVTVVKPLYDSLRGYIKKPDVAWFLHPLLCLIVPILYGLVTLKEKFLRQRDYFAGAAY